MNWILFGFKGVGKTHFGKLLAKKIGCPFLDTDELIEQKEGLSCREIVLQKGEAYFQKLEETILTTLQVQNHVIAVGGRSVLNEKNLQALYRLGSLLYLQCPKLMIKKRLLSSSPLPTFLDPQNIDASFEEIYCTRISQYAKIHSIPIDLEGKTEAEVVDVLWQATNLAQSFGSPPGENLMAKPSV